MTCTSLVNRVYHFVCLQRPVPKIEIIPASPVSTCEPVHPRTASISATHLPAPLAHEYYKNRKNTRPQSVVLPALVITPKMNTPTSPDNAPAAREWSVYVTDVELAVPEEDEDGVEKSDNGSVEWAEWRMMKQFQAKLLV